MTSQYTLEVCAYYLSSCLIAAREGAGRVELCASPLHGGITPSYGLIRAACEQLPIPVYPIIRPREGSFCYTGEELAVMRRDIELCREMGCEGISTGVQLRSGAIDTEQMKRIVEWAYPMQVTCHRVFDTTPDLYRALEELIACGCRRILTSGGQPRAADAIGTLTGLVEAAAGRIAIMPGSGVRAANIAALKATGAREYHSSALSTPQADPVAIQLFDAGAVYVADGEEIRRIMAHLS